MEICIIWKCPKIAIRVEQGEVASRRDQLKQMIHGESCRRTTRLQCEACDRRSRLISTSSKPRMPRPTKPGWRWLAQRRRAKKSSGAYSCPSRASVTNRRWSASRLFQSSVMTTTGQLRPWFGVASFTRKSGTMNASARIHGGRAAVRKLLYMAAVSASRHNPVMRRFYQRHIAHGNKFKVAVIAVLRGLRRDR